MVNGEVIGTAVGHLTLPKAAGTRHAVGAVSKRIHLLLVP